MAPKLFKNVYYYLSPRLDESERAKPAWITACVSKKKLLDEYLFLVPLDRGIFQGLVFCDTGLSDESHDILLALVYANGGRYSDVLTDEPPLKVTHLIANDSNSATFLAAQKAAFCHIVKPEWVNACLSSKQLVPEADYIAPGAQPFSPNHDTSATLSPSLISSKSLASLHHGDSSTLDMSPVNFKLKPQPRPSSSAISAHFTTTTTATDTTSTAQFRTKAPLPTPSFESKSEQSPVRSKPASSPSRSTPQTTEKQPAVSTASLTTTTTTTTTTSTRSATDSLPSTKSNTGAAAVVGNDDSTLEMTLDVPVGSKTKPKTGKEKAEAVVEKPLAKEVDKTTLDVSANTPKEATPSILREFVTPTRLVKPAPVLALPPNAERTSSQTSVNPSLFQGMSFYLSIEDAALLQSVQDDLLLAGGIVLDEYTSDNKRLSHFLCVSELDAMYKRAVDDKKILVTTRWLDHCILDNKIHDPSERVLYRPIRNQSGIKNASSLSIAVTGFMGNMREYMKDCVSVMGARYTKTLDRSNTHLVFAQPEGEKYLKAVEWGIKVVNFEWVEQCIAMWKILDEKRYNDALPAHVSPSKHSKKAPIVNKPLPIATSVARRLTLKDGAFVLVDIDPAPIAVPPKTETTPAVVDTTSGTSSVPPPILPIPEEILNEMEKTTVDDGTTKSGKKKGVLPELDAGPSLTTDRILDMALDNRYIDVPKPPRVPRTRPKAAARAPTPPVVVAVEAPAKPLEGQAAVDTQATELAKNAAEVIPAPVKEKTAEVTAPVTTKQVDPEILPEEEVIVKRKPSIVGNDEPTLHEPPPAPQEKSDLVISRKRSSTAVSNEPSLVVTEVRLPPTRQEVVIEEKTTIPPPTAAATDKAQTTITKASRSKKKKKEVIVTDDDSENEPLVKAEEIKPTKSPKKVIVSDTESVIAQKPAESQKKKKASRRLGGLDVAECPVCHKQVAETIMNDHVSECLIKQTAKQATATIVNDVPHTPERPPAATGHVVSPPNQASLVHTTSTQETHERRTPKRTAERRGDKDFSYHTESEEEQEFAVKPKKKATKADKLEKPQKSAEKLLAKKDKPEPVAVPKEVAESPAMTTTTTTTETAQAPTPATTELIPEKKKKRRALRDLMALSEDGLLTTQPVEGRSSRAKRKMDVDDESENEPLVTKKESQKPEKKASQKLEKKPKTTKKPTANVVPAKETKRVTGGKRTAEAVSDTDASGKRTKAAIVTESPSKVDEIQATPDREPVVPVGKPPKPRPTITVPAGKRKLADAYAKIETVTEVDDKVSSPEAKKHGSAQHDSASQIKSQLSELAGTTIRFQFSGVSEADVKEMSKSIRRLGGVVDTGHSFVAGTTHLIFGELKRVEKLLCACAGGLWVLKPDYIAASVAAGEFLREEDFEYRGDEVVKNLYMDSAHKWRMAIKRNGLPFAGWKVAVYGTPSIPVSTVSNVIAAGGGSVVIPQPPKFSELAGCKMMLVHDTDQKKDKCVDAALSSGVEVIGSLFIVDYLTRKDVPEMIDFRRFGEPSSGPAKSRRAK